MLRFNRVTPVFSVAWKLAVLSVLAVGITSAQERYTLVGSVVDIDGPQLSTNRLSEEEWFQAYPLMKTYLDERLRSDQDTTATIEFLLGGRAVISPGSEIEITSPRDTTVLKLKSGALWASFDKQDKPFRIETAGGAMGIEGTEFMVEVSDDGETELTVIEGALSVDGAEGEKRLVSAGEQAFFSRRRALRISRFASRDISREEARRLSLQLPGQKKKRFRAAIQRAVLQRSSSHRRMLRGMHRSSPESLEAILLALNEARTSRQNRRTDSNSSRRPRFSRSDISIVSKENGETPFEMTWTEVPDASEYVAVVTENRLKRELVWFGSSKQNKLAYPKNGPELKKGLRYHLFILPVGSAGSSDGRSSVAHTSFVSPGHSPVFDSLGAPTVDDSNEAARLSWEPHQGASSYGITIKSEDGQVVWSEETQSVPYNYPRRARALKPGTYSAFIEAYDATGLKVAESESLDFSLGFARPGR